MADADKSFEILIKTRAELTGAQAVLASLQEQIGAARALGRETADLEAVERRAAATVGEYNERLESAAGGSGNQVNPPQPVEANEGADADNIGKNRAENFGVGVPDGLTGGPAAGRDQRQLIDAQNATLEAFGELYNSERAHQAELFALLTRWMRDYRDTRAQVAELERQLGYLAGRQRANQNP